MYYEILWISSVSHSFQVSQIYTVYTLTAWDSWDTSSLHVQGKDRKLLRTARTKRGRLRTFAQDDFVIATVCHWYGCQSTLNILSIHNPCSFQIDFFSSVCRWQPDSTCLLTECQHRSEGDLCFPNWQHRYMGLYYIYIYICSLIKLLLLSTWLIFCMLLWVEILVAFVSHRSWQKRGT